MKNLLGNNILDNENSIHILKDVRAKSKSECCKSKTALINEDEPVGLRIETAVNIWTMLSNMLMK